MIGSTGYPPCLSTLSDCPVSKIYRDPSRIPYRCGARPGCRRQDRGQRDVRRSGRRHHLLASGLARIFGAAVRQGGHQVAGVSFLCRRRQARCNGNSVGFFGEYPNSLLAMSYSRKSSRLIAAPRRDQKMILQGWFCVTVQNRHLWPLCSATGFQQRCESEIRIFRVCLPPASGAPVDMHHTLH